MRACVCALPHHRPVSPIRPPSRAKVSNARAQMRMAALLESLLLGKVGTDKALDWLKYKQVSG